MKSFKERIEVNDNQDKCKDRATHKHSNGDLYVKADEPHEFGEWLNFKPSNGFWTKSLLITKNESVLTPIKKPTPTKFVKVEESIFDLKGEFERGELYEKGSDYTKLISESDFAFAYRENAVYRQVEIDWRDEVVELFGSGLIRRHGEGFQIGGVTMPSSTLVKLSHAIASLTEKPEGV